MPLKSISGGSNDLSFNMGLDTGLAPNKWPFRIKTSEDLVPNESDIIQIQILLKSIPGCPFGNTATLFKIETWSRKVASQWNESLILEWLNIDVDTGLVPNYNEPIENIILNLKVNILALGLFIDLNNDFAPPKRRHVTMLTN